MRIRGAAILWVFLLLLVGAMVSVGISWTGAIMHARGQLQRLMHSERSVISIELSPAWPAPPPSGWPDKPSGAVRFSGLAWTEVTAQTSDPVDTKWMGWQKWRGLSSDQIRCGWPLRCVRLWAWMDARSGPISATTYGPQISDPRVQRWFGGERLPVVPIWPGFALKTLFYAGIAWGVWQLPLALRRRSRARRGACVRCGYDLKGIAAGSACPECGSVR